MVEIFNNLVIKEGTGNEKNSKITILFIPSCNFTPHRPKTKIDQES